MSVLRAFLFFLIASFNQEVKVVFIDGPIETGLVRSIRGKIFSETELTITIQRSDGQITIGKNFIIKIENWTDRREFKY